ncbi:TonB-dependent siderophore receptor [Massilia sp. GCM10020059]|uniref:TonB-dependent siderophore receptor n=1 Tax=Massilia agrisoli TaxID=2892444 RepID=A0ABS8IT82_9BURK|nr:TonB-dependent siderophore receptor [Massilia agrisoli]MCC6071814.1 TonB-dependent siderophore receptor [Massilia agrisoli]
MSTPQLKHSAIALALLQAFAISAHAQETMPEVVITGQSVATDRAAIGGFSDAPLLYTPASITAISREQMQDLGIRNTTDAAKFDASISDSYNAVGYAEQFSIRGFALDNTSSYRKDGMAIPADTQIPLENKERIEVLKGLAGLQAGVAAPGGIVNYVTKRPTDKPLRSATVEMKERGSVYGAIDLGGRSEDKRFGYRINAAGERLRSYVKGADGEREFISGAFDWQISPQALLQLDMDYQYKSQITAPGYQLIRNESLPTGVSAKTLLNAQPWTKPVETKSSNVGLRFEYLFDNDWRASVAMNKHKFQRDDYTAFPYGCSNEGEGFYPGYCSNGDYDVYDYQSVGESKSPFSAQALLQGKFATGAVGHDLTVGSSFFRRSDRFGDYVYDYAGYSNIYQNLIVAPAPGNPTTGPVFERRRENERSVFAQDVLSLSQKFKLHAGLRHVQVKRTEFGVEPSDTSFTLPNVALVYNPTQDWTVYGSMAHGLEHGGVAPIETTNANRALDPGRSKQLEFGVKAAMNNRLNVSAAVFQVTKGLEFTQANEDGTATFVRAGEAQHRGVELGVQGKAAQNLQYSLSLAALDTEQSGTGQPGMDGKRVTNVPKFKSTAFVEYEVPGVDGLAVNGVWQYAGRKAFDVDNRTFVPGYHTLDLGAAYETRVMGTKTILRAGVQNVTDKFYWRDVTPALGGYLLPGAPRTFRVSAQFDF